MALTLYDAAGRARKIVLIVLVVVILILVWEAVGNLNSQTGPTGTTVFRFYMDPDNAFPVLPQLSVAEVSIDKNVTSNYAIENLFPGFPDVAYVYKIDKPREKIDTLENAVVTSKTLGFDTYQTPVDSNYTWLASQNTKTLKFNTQTQVWSMTTDYFNNLDVKKLTTVNPDVDSYKSMVIGLINAMGFGSSPGLTSGQLEATLADLGTNGVFFKPETEAQAKYVFLDVYRRLRFADLKPDSEFKDIKDKSIVPLAYDGLVYTSDPRVGEFRVVIGGTSTDYTKSVLELNFTNFDYSVKSSQLVVAKNYVITPDEAWTNAQSGKGFLTSLIPEGANPLGDYSNLETIGVKRFVADAQKTVLGYYESEEWTGYVIPIYIFSGKAELNDGRLASFKIYVDAIKRAQ